MQKINRAQLAKIHIACKDLGIDKETRQSMLSVRFGKESSGQLSSSQADKLLAEFGQRGWKPKRKKKTGNSKTKYNDLGNRPGMATPPMLRKIEAMWKDVSRAADKEKALKTFLKNKYGVDNIKFLPFKAAKNAIIAMGHM